jgi:hypothetical protein
MTLVFSPLLFLCYLLLSNQIYNQLNLFQVNTRICIPMIMLQMENTDYITHSLYKEMKGIQIQSSSLPLF